VAMSINSLALVGVLRPSLLTKSRQSGADEECPDDALLQRVPGLPTPARCFVRAAQAALLLRRAWLHLVELLKLCVLTPRRDLDHS
jgi:hypothetical protein